MLSVYLYAIMYILTFSILFYSLYYDGIKKFKAKFCEHLTFTFRQKLICAILDKFLTTRSSLCPTPLLSHLHLQNNISHLFKLQIQKGSYTELRDKNLKDARFKCKDCYVALCLKKKSMDGKINFENF